ncbi:MAG: hypothetical protein ACKV2T_26070 [Kofleriaceae bacterium]
MSRSVLSVLAIPLLAFTGCILDEDVTENDTEQASSYHHPYDDPEQTRNRAGIAGFYSPLGSLPDLVANNPFFADLGTNGRTCASCHGFEGGFTTSHAQRLWNQSNGTDPLFMVTFDIGKCPDSDISTKRKRRDAMELTLERGSVRAGMNRVQPTAEFEITMVEDPYHCAQTSLTQFFGYRKPNPLTSASQKSSVTWAPGPQPDMRATLKGLFVGATLFHGATTVAPAVELQEEATDFMLFNYFAQIIDDDAGRLDDDGARGGPVHLANQDWFLGINHASTGTTTRKVFDIFDAWIDSDTGHRRHSRKWRARAQIAEGQEIFNFRENANGGTCSGCHNSPNVGTRSVFQLFDIRVVDIDDPELPRVHLRNKTTGVTRIVSNLGRAAATGLWADIGRMSVPLLRGLSSRGPYFHAGQARTLMDVVEHYDTAFAFNFTSREKKALAAFLSAL